MRCSAIITMVIFFTIISSSYLYSQPFEYESYEIVNQYQGDEGEFSLGDALLLKNKKEQIKSVKNKLITDNFSISNIFKGDGPCTLFYKEPQIYQIDEQIYIVEYGREAEKFIMRKSDVCGGLYILEIDSKQNKIEILKEFPWIITSDDSMEHYSFVGKIQSKNLIIIKQYHYYYSSYQMLEIVNKKIKTYKNSIPIGFNKVNKKEYFSKSEWKIEWPEELYRDYVKFVNKVKSKKDIDEFFTNLNKNNYPILNLSSTSTNINGIKKALKVLFYEKFNPYIAYCQGLDNQYFIRYPSYTIYIEKNVDKFRISKINNDR